MWSWTTWTGLTASAAQIVIRVTPLHSPERQQGRINLNPNTDSMLWTLDNAMFQVQMHWPSCPMSKFEQLWSICKYVRNGAKVQHSSEGQFSPEIWSQNYSCLTVERFPPIGGQYLSMEAAMTNHRSSHRSALASAHHTQFDLQISADNAPGPVLDGGKLNNFLLCYYQGCYIS